MSETKDSIITSPLEDVLHNSMIPYAEYVILDRALPRVEDGLKPVQRRILYSMYEQGMTPDKGYKKSARVVGDCLAKYHPHGDSSVYDAMVRLAQPYNMRNTLVDGHGNFGSIDGDSAAAMRYTEVRLQQLALELLTDIDKDTVNWSLNFDDSLKEPDTLPGRFPNLLVNGATGIAVGLATNIPTHNLAEVIDGVVAYLNDPKISLDEMMKIVKGPDFPTGGYIIAGSELRNAYETGKGKITLRAKISIEEGEGKKKNIVITELPYQVNKAQLLKKIADLQEENKEALAGRADIADESDRSGMRAVIRVRKDYNPQPILDFLFKYTQLQCTYGINMVAIADGKPKLMGLLEIIKYYVDYQINIVVRRTRYDLNKAKERAHILEGLIIAVNNIDEVIRIIKTSPDTPAAKANLRAAFDLSDKQAQAILDLRLARITKLEVNNLKEELENLKKLIAELQAILDSKKLQKDVVKKEILAIRKKYRDDRRSVIVSSADEISFDKTAEKSYVENIVIGYNLNGVIRKVKAATYKKYAKNSAPNKAELFAFKVDTDTSYMLYAFTNLGNCYKIDPEALPEASGAMSGGITFNKLIKNCGKDEVPVAFYAAKDDDFPTTRLFFFTKGGMVKLTPWSEYDVKKPVFQAIKLKEGDELLKMEEEIPDSDYFFATKNGYCLNCSDEFPQQLRVASGVKGMDIEDGDEIITATQISKKLDYEIVVATSFGTFKKVDLGTISKTARARKGVRLVDVGFDGKECVKLAVPKDEAESMTLLIEDGDGNIMHALSEDLASESRTTKGRPIAKLGMFKTNFVCFFRGADKK